MLGLVHSLIYVCHFTDGVVMLALMNRCINLPFILRENDASAVLFATEVSTLDCCIANSYAQLANKSIKVFYDDANKLKHVNIFLIITDSSKQCIVCCLPIFSKYN